MTEAEWNACTEPRHMLAFLRGKVSDRKLRLFAVASCRRVCHLLTDERSRSALACLERHIEGLASDQQLQAASATAGQAFDDARNRIIASVVGPGLFRQAMTDKHQRLHDFADVQAAGKAQDLADKDPFVLAAAGVWCASGTETDEFRASGYDLIDIAIGTADYAAPRPGDEVLAQTGVVRCIFGSLPFRPVVLDPAWLTSTVTSLAEAIYTDRAFDRLPILADALEDAGCTNPDILSHCRGGGEHVRGCWALDLVLGKE